MKRCKEEILADLGKLTTSSTASGPPSPTGEGFKGASSSTAVRSRSESDTSPTCHSTSSRRFATSPPTSERPLTVADIIEKRRQRWAEKRDIEYDKALVKASVRKILSTSALVDEIRARPYLLIEVAFYIVDKKRETVPFFFNEVQRDFIHQLETRGTGKPYFVLKGRQQGFTSVITAIQLSFAIVRKNFSGFTMADRSDNTQAIFNDKARVVYDRLPDELKPSEKFNSRNEMFFDKLNSSWRIATATDQVGRSRTLNFVHFSEVAFYECDLAALQAGIGEAITADAIVVYESTANGFNQAKDLWDSEACHNLFYEWWRSPEYRSTEYEYLETDDAWLIERLRVLEELGCDREQLAWYAKKYAGYLDKALIRQEYPCTPEEAFISSGGCVFDRDALTNRITACKALVPKKGYFSYHKEAIPINDSEGKPVDVEWRIKDIEFIEAADGYIRIHEDPMVQRDRWGDIAQLAPYVLGGDTAGSGEDYFAAKVICNLDGRTVATFHKQRIDEDLFAEQIYCLGKYYHDALIGLEINYSRHPTRVLWQKYNYPNMYMREKLDGLTDKPVLDYGFETTPKTKPIIIGELVEIMRSNITLECDVATLDEMTRFVKKDNGKLEASEGSHDDLVMSLAITHFISKKQTASWMAVQSGDNEFIKANFNLEKDSDGEEYSYAAEESFMDWDEL